MDDTNRRAYILLVAGSAARLLASLYTVPLELVWTRQPSVASSLENPIQTSGMTRQQCRSRKLFGWRRSVGVRSPDGRVRRPPPGVTVHGAAGAGPDLAGERRIQLENSIRAPEDGVALFYVGLASTLWQDMPFRVID